MYGETPPTIEQLKVYLQDAKSELKEATAELKSVKDEIRAVNADIFNESHKRKEVLFNRYSLIKDLAAAIDAFEKEGFTQEKPTCDYVELFETRGPLSKATFVKGSRQPVFSCGDSKERFNILVGIEKRYNNGMTAEEAQLAYPRMGQHSHPVFHAVFRSLKNKWFDNGLKARIKAALRHNPLLED
jgi:hypothetical protein